MPCNHATLRSGDHQRRHAHLAGIQAARFIDGSGSRFGIDFGDARRALVNAPTVFFESDGRKGALFELLGTKQMHAHRALVDLAFAFAQSGKPSRLVSTVLCRRRPSPRQGSVENRAHAFEIPAASNAPDAQVLRRDHREVPKTLFVAPGASAFSKRRKARDGASRWP